MYYMLFCLISTNPTEPVYIATFDGAAPKITCEAVAAGLTAAMTDEKSTVRCGCKPTVRT